MRDGEGPVDCGSGAFTVEESLYLIYTQNTGMQGTVWYRYSLSGLTMTLQSVDNVSYSYKTSFPNKDTYRHNRGFYLTKICVRYWH